MSPLDPRRGVPSASAMDRLINCPPSHEMEKHFPDAETEGAASGTRIHAVLAGDAQWNSLTLDEQDTAEMCYSQASTIADEWEANRETAITEHRLGLTALGKVLDVTPDSKASFIFTGQTDLVYIMGLTALVIDYKTGRNSVAVAQDNPQLAALAVLVAKRYNVSHVRVAIVQPWAGKPTIADYSINALVLAESWLKESLMMAATSTPDDARAGDHCKWCKAKAGCKAFNLAAMKQIEVIDPMSIAGMNGTDQRAAMFARAMELAPESLIASYRGLSMVRRYLDAIDGAFKTRVQAGEIPGWHAETKPGNREITDAQKAFTALEPLGITSEDVIEICSIPIGELENRVRVRSGIKLQTPGRTTYNLTGKAAKEAVDAALNAVGVIARKGDKVELVEEIQPEPEGAK